MCFILDKGKINEPPKVAEKDMTVYKVMKYQDGKLQSYFYPSIETWEKGDTLHTDLLKLKDGTVTHGLHSYSGDVHIRKCRLYNNNVAFIASACSGGPYFDSYLKADAWNLVIAKCEIPSGSEFYEGASGQIVSNRLKLQDFALMDECPSTGVFAYKLSEYFRKLKDNENNRG